MVSFGGKNEERKLAWVSWEKICVSKKEGGLAMRNLEVFNNAISKTSLASVTISELTNGQGTEK